MSTTRSVTEPVPGAAVTSASRRLKHVCCLVAGGTPSVDDPANWSEGDDGVPWAVIGDMSGTDFVGSTTRHVSSLGIAAKNLPLSTLQTVLFAMYASVGAVARPKIQLSWNQAILGLEPFTDAADSRFLSYWLRALKPRLSEFLRSNTQDNLNAESVGNLPFPAHVPGHQRAIADFLDAETARIDALIAKKRRMIDLLNDRHAGLFQSTASTFGLQEPTGLKGWLTNLPQGWRQFQLGRTLVQLTNGYVGPTRDLLRDDGVPYVQSLHIKAGRIDFSRRPYFVGPEWHRERPRIHLRQGDVLIVQTGDVGQVAVVPAEFGEASCHALQIARVRPDLLTGQYLAAYLQSPFGYQSLLSRATGALHPHLEAGIRDLPVPVPPLGTQNAIVTLVSGAARKIESVVAAITRQLDLLAEHRQALITAAVTGQIEIPVPA